MTLRKAFGDVDGVLCSFLPKVLVVILAVAALSVTAESAARPLDSERANTEIVRGLVTNEDNEPVPNAVIVGETLGRQKFSATSDEQGHFQITVPVKTQRLSLRIRDVADTKMWVGDVYFAKRFDGKRPGLDKPIQAKLVTVIESLVQVVDEHAHPIAGATVVVQKYITEVAVLTTDAKGQVKARLPDGGTPSMVIAFKSGCGYDYFSGDVRDTNNYPVKNPPRLPARLKLVLDGTRTIRVRAVNSMGEGVSGITVRPWYVNKEGNVGDTNFGSNAFTQTTNSDGLTIFDWIPPNVKHGVTFWLRSEEYDADRLSVKSDQLDETKDYELKLQRLTALAGRVVDEAGDPVDGALVQANGTGISMDSSSGEATTDAAGNFSMLVAPDKAYVAHVVHGGQVGYVSPIVIREGKSVTDVEIRLKTATAVRGKVTRGMPPKPVADQWISLRLDLGALPAEIEQLRPAGDRFVKSMYHQQGVRTDSKGLYLFFAAPGKYVLHGPRQAKVEQFTITDERHISRNFRVPREELAQFKGTVTDPRGKPVVAAKIHGVYASQNTSRHEFIGKTNGDGEFDIERETQPAIVHVQSADKSLAAVFKIDEDMEERNVSLRPTYSATGQLLNEAGEPIVSGVVKFGINVHLGDENAAFMTSFGGKTMTDNQGQYSIDHLAQGIEYSITFEVTNNGPWNTIATHSQETAELVDLGKKTLSVPEPAPKEKAD